MRGNPRSAILVLLGGLILTWSTAAARSESNDVPASRAYIIDNAHVLQPDAIRSIDDWLQELQQKTGAQVKLLTVRTTGGEDFFTFVERQFEHWKLGQAGKDNGALIALDVNDHKVRVHTGYGLEGVLPDSWCGSLSREAVAKYFRAGSYSDGLIYMVKAVAFRIGQDAGVTLTGIPAQVHQVVDQPPQSPWASILFVLAVFLLIYLLNRFQSGGGGRGGRGMWLGPRIGSSGWGNSYGGDWGSSSGGGWGGSFGGGGGGGGSFGGGGSTGGGGGGASW